MILEIEKKMNRLEDLRIDSLKEIELLDKSQLHFKSSDDSWSIVETLQHLYLAESGILKYISKKLEQPDVLNFTGIKNKLSSALMVFLLKSPVKFKLPKGAPIIPDGNVSLGDLLSDWNLLRKQWIEVLDLIDVQTANKLIFKHPRAGYLNAHQVLEFMEAHFLHHLQQIERIKNHAAFPSSSTLIKQTES